MKIPVSTNNKFYFLVTVISLFIFSLIGYLINYPGHRYTLQFSEIGTDRCITEVRYLPAKPVQGKVQSYVDELLLGPSVHRTRPLFSRGTKAEFCFQRGKTLYIGLNTQAVFQDSEAESFEKGLALLEKNVRKNFSGIRHVECFIDGYDVSLRTASVR